MSIANSGSVGRGKTFDRRKVTSLDMMRTSGSQHRDSIGLTLPESTFPHNKASDSDNTSLVSGNFDDCSSGYAVFDVGKSSRVSGREYSHA